MKPFSASAWVSKTFLRVCAKGFSKWETLGETTPRLTSGQLWRNLNRTIKDGRDHGPAQEASLSPILTYNTKMTIQLEYPHLVQIMGPPVVSECLRFCIAERLLLFLPKIVSRFAHEIAWDHPTHAAAVFINASVQIMYWYEPRAECTPARRPLSVEGRTRRGPPTGGRASLHPILTSNHHWCM